MKKTHDDIHHYRGLWRDGGRCRIEVYAPEAGDADRHPVIVASERDDNAGSSVTNMAEYLAAEVVAWLGGTLRRALGTPEWAPRDRAAVAARLGEAVARRGR